MMADQALVTAEDTFSESLLNPETRHVSRVQQGFIVHLCVLLQLIGLTD